MGCTGSKQSSRCRHCQSPISPVTRSYSMHVHHPAVRKGDSYHVVALTSTTLGSIKLDSSNNNHRTHNRHSDANRDTVDDENSNYRVTVDDEKFTFQSDPKVNVTGVDGVEGKKREFSMGMIEAKTWSDMINRKIPNVAPKTPIMTPPGEPETINTWELMEGLEDTSPLHRPHHFRSFSFNVVHPISQFDQFDQPKSKIQENGHASPPKAKPMWLEMADHDEEIPNSNLISKTIASEFDPEVIATFRKALEELSPTHPFHLKPLDIDKQGLNVVDSKKLNLHGVMDENMSEENGKDRVVLYFTSLRGVRKTYEDCCSVRLILKGLGFRVDERDVSMHLRFKDELRELLGDGFSGESLPRLFVGTRYIGGAEELKRMHEEGDLEKALEGCQRVDVDSCGGGNGACEACGDVRFVVCETCCGSCKVFYEGDDEEFHDECEEGDEVEYGFQRCPDCNENGIVLSYLLYSEEFFILLVLEGKGI
ncbi:Glutaredoxin [Dillenia turbinata]|uniref:Glutaredoxin n=1 Tax=Dillenia turbinata TaxID=194707 RepID=A0AAN8UNJ5_9MAGN